MTSARETGLKYDSDKPRMSLLPARALESVADVLTFGAKKYGPNNWRLVDNMKERYLNATLRHISAIMKDEDMDPESGLPHAAHAICGLMFMLDIELGNKAKYDTTELQSVMDQMVRGSETYENTVTVTTTTPSYLHPFLTTKFDPTHYTGHTISTGTTK